MYFRGFMQGRLDTNDVFVFCFFDDFLVRNIAVKVYVVVCQYSFTNSCCGHFRIAHYMCTCFLGEPGMELAYAVGLYLDEVSQAEVSGGMNSIKTGPKGFCIHVVGSLQLFTYTGEAFLHDAPSYFDFLFWHIVVFGGVASWRKELLIKDFSLTVANDEDRKHIGIFCFQVFQLYNAQLLIAATNLPGYANRSFCFSAC